MEGVTIFLTLCGLICGVLFSLCIFFSRVNSLFISVLALTINENRSKTAILIVFIYVTTVQLAIVMLQQPLS